MKVTNHGEYYVARHNKALGIGTSYKHAVIDLFYRINTLSEKNATVIAEQAFTRMMALTLKKE